MSAAFPRKPYGGFTTVTERGELLLIQFARVPVSGRVKTRLIPALGEEGACQLHINLMQHCCQRLLAAELAPVELWLDSEVEHPAVSACRAQGAALRCQRGANLGQRMHHALVDGLARYRRVVLVGSDCPGIDGQYLRRANLGLDSVPLCLGPATDGGYVLIGARRSDPGLFEGVQWGADTVLADTLANIGRLGWGVEVLSELADIDRPEDLPVWQAFTAP